MTVITSVKCNTAKGYTINGDFTTSPCYIVKHNNHFAHGETLKKAIDAVMDKIFDDMPEEERIEAFWECHDKEKKYPASDFFEWHNKLTGSCEFGRQQFAKDNGIDLDKDTFTVAEFVALTKGSYGGEIIAKLI
jgi:hypothetical protein